ncbi:ATP synthase F0 subunit B [bacterium]|jgi:F-type H+-transporting ATPase subunit b|nr:ATP synthase F0 subunit B [bacterium]MBT6293687.1 ATP synthase F0 subunit B [bacterium]
MEGLANLGINIQSLIIYIVNFGILVLVLNRYLFKPLAGFLDKRQNNIKHSLEEANTIQVEFQKKLNEIQEEKVLVEKKLNQELSNLRSFVESKRTEMLKEIEQQRSEMISKAQNEVDEMKMDAFESSRDDLNKFIKIALSKIVSENISEDAINKSFESSWNQFTKNSK